MTPLEVKHILYTNLSICTCVDLDEALPVIKELLTWANLIDPTVVRPSYEDLFPNNGIYYLLISYLQGADLVTHGTSCRHPFLTLKGKELLEALQKYTVSEIDNSSGEINGSTYTG